VFEQSIYFDQNFSELEYKQESFQAIEFDNCNFSDCNFSESTFQRCKFIDCTFTRCNFSNAQFDLSKMNEVTFSESKLVGIDWSKLDWPSLSLPCPMQFHACLLSHSSFFGLEISELIMQHCKAQEVDFRSANISQGQFNFSDFSGSLFNQSNISGASFEDAYHYDIDIFNNRIKGALFSRDEALSLLNSLDIELV